MKKTVLFLSVSILLASCTAGGFGAASGGMYGGWIGGHVGDALFGHRGYHAGTVIGVITGAAIGAAAATAEERRYNDYVEDYDRASRSSYTSARRVESDSRSADRSYTSSANARTSAGTGSQEAVKCPLTLRNLRFIDDGANQTINRNEECKIIFELANTTSSPIYDVVPYVYETSGNSHILISPSTRIEVVKSGDVIRYACTLKADNKLSAGTLQFRISVSCADSDFVTLRDFSLPSAK